MSERNLCHSWLQLIINIIAQPQLASFPVHQSGWSRAVYWTFFLSSTSFICKGPIIKIKGLFAMPISLQRSLNSFTWFYFFLFISPPPPSLWLLANQCKELLPYRRWLNLLYKIPCLKMEFGDICWVVHNSYCTIDIYASLWEGPILWLLLVWGSTVTSFLPFIINQWVIGNWSLTQTFPQIKYLLLYWSPYWWWWREKWEY